MAIDKTGNEFSSQMSRKAPEFLDQNGLPYAEDPLKDTWNSLTEAFSRLQGQRMLELMKVMLSEVPENERVVMEWEGDETYSFYLRFSNGWSLSKWTERANKACDFRYEHVSNAKAPKWFPKDKQGLDRWKKWYDLLHKYSISPSVDNLVHQRLQELSDQLYGFSRKDLPLIEEALLGPEWGSSLQYIELSSAAPKELAQSAPKRRI